MKYNKNQSLVELYDVVLNLADMREAESFFADLCTPAELRAMQERWIICQLLDHGDLSYREIQNTTKASLTTIGRVSRFLKEENNNGYRSALQKIKQKKSNENS